MKLLDTLLLIGDQYSDRHILREIFREDYNLLEADSIEQGLFLLEQNSNCISAVIVDRPPPRNSRDSFLGESARLGLIGDIPMLAIITPSNTGQMEELAFSLGASDVIPRPYTEAIIRRRVKIMVDLFRNRQHMRSILAAQAETIRHTNEVMVDALSSIIEYRSSESGGHILRIRRFTEILLTEVAASHPEYGLTKDAISNIASASALHDIGKISIPDVILNKPGKLTPEEFSVMRTHTINGCHMIRTLTGATSEEYLRYAYNICRSHHERWDGSGYPDGLKGEEIPICAQVVGLADAFDALTTKRIYKPAYSTDTAVSMILNGECGLFSPKLLECFKRVCRQFMELAQEYSDGRSPSADVFSMALPDPVHRTHSINSPQMAQLKYHALLHYTECTVVEMDLSLNTYHVVYNPTLHFHPIPKGHDLIQHLKQAYMCHPDDAKQTASKYQFLFGDFFDLGLRKYSFHHRVYSPVIQDYLPYQVTFLRLDTGNAEERKGLLIWRPLSTPNPTAAQPDLLSLLQSKVVRRRWDRWYTLLSGQETLISLLGYTPQELGEQFQNRFLELVHPADRENLHKHNQECLRTSHQTASEYRMLHKNGHVVWILEQGCVIEEDGHEVFYGSLIDNSASHTTQAKLEATLQRNQILLDQTDDIIFEWDLSDNSLSISPKWNDVFGYEPAVHSHRLTALHSSHIHPDDLPLLLNLAAAIRAGQHFQEEEFRVANAEGKYVWCRIRATALQDSSGIPYRAVGIIANIDSNKRATLALREMAQQDSLTGLLNKASAQEHIRAYLDSPENTGHSALLMLDLDNFKQINDRFGHLFGDTVLAQTAKAIRKLFRGGDIIGRVGGDEFLIFMKGIQDEHLVRERCELLLQCLLDLFQSDSQTGQVSCSVGVSLSPEHGTSFQELFQRADQALYHSKQNGKHCYTVYQGTLDMTIQQFSSTIGARIDSNEQPGLADSSLLRAVFHQLSHSTDLEKSIQEVLALVGQQSNVSRIYIFENNDANTHCYNTFEWCNEGISPQINNLQHISYVEDIPDWESNYDENGVLFWTDISKVRPEYRAILEPQGVKSMLHCAIRENGVFRGYIGLDECINHRIWTQEQVDLLTFLSEVVVSFLLKKRSQDRSAAMSENLRSILDAQNNWVYVIDPETFQLRYINEKTRKTVPSLRENDVCYQHIMDRQTPCPNCPMMKLGAGGCARTQIYSPALNAPVESEAATIQWNGRPACLITCRVQG